jgi:hypothetical protein
VFASENAYLNAETKEKIFTIAGKEFGFEWRQASLDSASTLRVEEFRGAMARTPVNQRPYAISVLSLQRPTLMFGCELLRKRTGLSINVFCNKALEVSDCPSNAANIGLWWKANGSDTQRQLSCRIRRDYCRHFLLQHPHGS